MIFLLALLTIVWDAATHDCRGGLEPSVRYEVLVYEARVTGMMTDGFGNVVPVYARNVQRPTTATTALTITEPNPPAPGEVTFISDPVAIDLAGNRSDETCYHP